MGDIPQAKTNAIEYCLIGDVHRIERQNGFQIPKQ